ncbi:hypothetical protein BEH_07570 [Priestia filamentosa]|uniref:Uncharacterized protein n=1 Tax=Priestia filamentosa TaxID=1402861 RepID=A0A0H4KI44_9BACI|nr:hypothetical protein [Priestia filamentosa]AKO91969.1 hypothetical protein BEH_07570 [Priestia filamentosa]
MIIDSPLFKDFPKVALTADNYGFTYEDISYLMDIVRLDPYCQQRYRGEGSIEIALKTIIFRLDLKKEAFYNFVSTLQAKDYEDMEHLSFLVGKYHLAEFVAIVNALGNVK